MYVPILMKDMNIGTTEEQKSEIIKLWDGMEPESSEEVGPGNGGLFWNCPTGYFTVGVLMLMTDREG